MVKREQPPEQVHTAADGPGPAAAGDGAGPPPQPPECRAQHDACRPSARSTGLAARLGPHGDRPHRASVARAHQPVRAREPAWADEVATAVARVGEELALPPGPPADEHGGTADDQEFFWRSAAQDGPAGPWRSLFR